MKPQLARRTFNGAVHTALLKMIPDTPPREMRKIARELEAELWPAVAELLEEVSS